MEKFEIHITGTENIISVLKELEVKSLHAEMRNPYNETIGIEYMSSFIKEFENYEACKKWVDSFYFQLESKGIEICRVKIECPYFYEHYRTQSVYLEAHFPTTDFNKQYPFVYNVNSEKYVSTNRVFLKSEYDDFIERFKQVHHSEIEYCLFDDNIRHDEIWIKSFHIENKSNFDDNYLSENISEAKNNFDKACEVYRNYVGKAETREERLRRINAFRCG